MKPIKFVEAMLERDGHHDWTDPEVQIDEANLRPEIRAAIKEAFDDLMERGKDGVSGEDRDEIISSAVDAVMEEVEKRCDVRGGDEPDFGVPLTIPGDSVMRRLEFAGFLSFTEIAIVKLDDLKALIAELEEERGRGCQWCERLPEGFMQICARSGGDPEDCAEEQCQSEGCDLSTVEVPAAVSA